MLFAKINDNNALEIDLGGASPLIDGAAVPIDMVRLSAGRYHIILHGRSYNAEVVEINRQTKTVSIKINGVTQDVQLKDKFDLLLEKLGMNATANVKMNNVRAPMPGLIIELRVTAGQTILAGDPLLILEAMKMENIIKAAGDGIVKRVNVKKGDSVEKGQVLIEF